MGARELMPETAAFVDAVRDAFGGVEFGYAQEGGYEIGTRVITEPVGTTAGGKAGVHRIMSEESVGNQPQPITDEERRLVQWAIYTAARSVVEAQRARGTGEATVEMYRERYGDTVADKIRDRAKQIWREEGQ